MSKIVHLKTPISQEQIRNLNLEDEVYLSGDAYCMLYAEHYNLILDMIKQGEQLPMTLEGSVLYNTGVIWRKAEDGSYLLHALGTTASYKFNAYTPEFIRRTGVRAIIGKGGMDQSTLDAMEECGCVFLAVPGGCTSIFTPKAEIVEEYSPKIPPMDNQRLRFKFNEFGPLLVTMDAHGNSIYQDTTENIQASVKRVYDKLGL